MKRRPDRPSEPATGDWNATVLTADDLRGFSKDARRIVLDAMTRGWAGRVSASGHAILRHPSGGTASVARHLSRGNRSYQNAIADLARVERDAEPDTAEPDTAEPDTAEPAPDAAAPQPAPEPASARPQPRVTAVGPYFADGGGADVVYACATTRERRWDDGAVDYLCAVDGCTYAAPQPRSVALHHSLHVTRGEASPNPLDPTIWLAGGTVHTFTPTSDIGDVLAVYELLSGALPAHTGLPPLIQLADDTIQLLHHRRRDDADDDRRAAAEARAELADAHETLHTIRDLVAGDLAAQLAARTAEADARAAEAAELRVQLGALRENISSIAELAAALNAAPAPHPPA